MIPSYVQAIGYIAQALFSTRFLVQWFRSEKAKKVLAPLLFWQISLMASSLLIIYAILVKDISILFGQLVGYFIYTRNLHLKGYWPQINVLLRIIILVLPFIAILFLSFNSEYNFESFIDKHTNSLTLIWGLTGQLIFSMRFIYQWLYSEKVNKSVLPLGFWIISIAGSLIISSYSLYFELFPILVGHFIGIIMTCWLHSYSP